MKERLCNILEKCLRQIVSTTESNLRLDGKFLDNFWRKFRQTFAMAAHRYMAALRYSGSLPVGFVFLFLFRFFAKFPTGTVGIAP